MIDPELPNLSARGPFGACRLDETMRELRPIPNLPLSVESRFQRAPSLRPYVSPMLEKLTDTPFARKQLAFRFKLDDSMSANTTAKPIQLASVSFARQQVRGTLHLRPDLSVQRVFVRYTCDGWTTFTDSDATFIGKECYFFTFDVPSDVRDSDSVVAFVFACQLSDRSIVWDNNNGSNYCADVCTRQQRHQLASAAQMARPLAQAQAQAQPQSKSTVPPDRQSTTVNSS